MDTDAAVAEASDDSLEFLRRDGVETLAVRWGLVAALVALRRRHTFDEADRWDGPSAAVPVVTLVVATIDTGGPQSPVWVLVFLATAYLANTLSGDLRSSIAQFKTTGDRTEVAL